MQTLVTPPELGLGVSLARGSDGEHSSPSTVPLEVPTFLPSSWDGRASGLESQLAHGPPVDASSLAVSSPRSSVVSRTSSTTSLAPIVCPATLQPSCASSTAQGVRTDFIVPAASSAAHGETAASEAATSRSPESAPRKLGCGVGPSWSSFSTRNLDDTTRGRPVASDPSGSLGTEPSARARSKPTSEISPTMW